MSDSISTAFSDFAPADERADAQGTLQQTHMPTASDLLPTPAVQELIDHIQDQYAEQQLIKSARIYPFPGRPEKPIGMQSVYLDGLQIFARGDYFERPNPVGYETLRTMVEQTPVLNAVLLTRIRQVQRFAAPQDGGRGSGFLITHRDRLHKLTKSELEQTQLLSRFLSNCGWEFNPRQRRRLKRDTLSQFLAKVVRESLTYDSAPIETEMKVDKKKGFDGFYSVDGSTIRLCTDEGYRGDDEIYAVQAIQGRVVTAYSYDDLIYEPRNPRADVRLAGYGLGETELLIKVVTGFLNAMTYNSKGFDDNSIPKGILHLTGEYDTRDLAAFRRYWNAMVKGVNNAWTLPVMVSKDSDSKAVFERIDAGFDEMHFSKWMTFLVSVICAIYGMSPAEINFDSFSGGNTSPLGGSDTAEKLAASKDSGLRPLMAYLESLLSDYLIADFSDSLVFRWAGLDEVDEAQRLDIRKTILTVNEMRAEEGYEAMEGPIGEAPVNPTLSGVWLQLAPGGGEGTSPPRKQEAGAEEEPDDRELKKAKWDDSLLKANPHHDALGKFSSWSDTARQALDRLLRKLRERDFSGRAEALLPVSDAVVHAATRAGVDVSGFSHAADVYALHHVLKGHGDVAVERARGQIPVTEEDLRRIPDLVQSPDHMAFGTKSRIGRDLLIYLKRFPDGSVLHLEEVRTGKRQLALQSMRKYPATIDAASILRADNLNARSDGGDALSIVDFPPLVKADSHHYPVGKGSPGECLSATPTGDENPLAQVSGSTISAARLPQCVNRSSTGQPFGAVVPEIWRIIG